MAIVGGERTSDVFKFGKSEFTSSNWCNQWDVWHCAGYKPPHLQLRHERGVLNNAGSGMGGSDGKYDVRSAVEQVCLHQNIKAFILFFSRLLNG